MNQKLNPNRVRRAVAALLLLCLLSGCSPAAEQPQAPTSPSIPGAVTAVPTPTAEAAPSPTAEVTAPPATPAPEQPISVSSPAEIKAALRRAIEALQPGLDLDVTGCDLGAEPKNLVRNLYYELLDESPELKYTYDVTSVYDPAGQAINLTFSYMPFKTKTQPNSEDLEQIDTLQDLIAAARNGLGEDSIGIYIANTDLDVDTMSLTLGQVGGAYVLCDLSRDATEILYRPTNGRTMEACLDYLAQTDALADAVLSQVCTPDMTQEEQLAAVYAHLTETVRYDRRYYDDPDNMPYESLTAYGALQDGLAICGGYALSLQLLCDKIGLDCYTVSGMSRGEHHMWNVIRLNGVWRYYDATYDRGGAKFGYRWFGVEEAVLADNRTWNQELVRALEAE